MPRADHIFVHRTGYTHHGIDAGDGTVIHYTGEVGQKADAAVRRTDIVLFARGGEIQVRAYAACDPEDRTIDRAMGRLGESKYHLVINNCEHFATWCRTGKHESEQVRNGVPATGGVAGGAAAVGGSIGAVSAAGAVAGLSAPGIMSGLATVGGAIGGGAVAGVALLGAAPGVIATVAMSRVLEDNEALDERERQARRLGRWASGAGAAGGTLATVSAVAVLGTSGLSAAGITSGLAAVGGGMMVGGVAVAAAAPAVAAAVIGYGAYRGCMYWSKKRGRMRAG